MKKRNKSKEAKFFCESCGSEVPRNSRTCPTCGKFFASVRCPQCGRIGSNDDFKNGCPTCGYAVNPDTGMGHGGSAAELFGYGGSDSSRGKFIINIKFIPNSNNISFQRYFNPKFIFRRYDHR